MLTAIRQSDDVATYCDVLGLTYGRCFFGALREEGGNAGGSFSECCHLEISPIASLRFVLVKVFDKPISFRGVPIGFWCR